jgi:PAS domain S-box-containing protein
MKGGEINYFSRSPLRMLILVAISVFLVEFGLMLLIIEKFLGNFSYAGKSFIDSLLLAVILYPALYYFIFKPLKSANSDFKKFKLAVEAASDHIIIADSDGKIIYANPMAEKITGYGFEEMKGKTPRLWGGQMPQEFYEKLWNAIKKEKKAFIGELKNKRKNGEIYEAEINISPILGANGEAEFFVGIERDVTKERQVEKAKSEFLSLASHQLRTPLSATRWTLDLFMEDKTLSEKNKERLKDLYDSNMRLINLVNNLLNVSRIEAGRLPVNKKPVDVISLIEESYKTCLPNAEKKKQKIKMSVGIKDGNAIIDPMLFGEALNNLLSNAINYAPENSEIEVSAGLKGGKYSISVHNAGPAISGVDREKLFEKFYRGVDSQSVKTEGSGLGLFIAKSAVEANGGNIGFDSSEKDGTIFYFTVPAA